MCQHVLVLQEAGRCAVLSESPGVCVCTMRVCAVLTWNTLGALTSEARAEDRVAEKIPAVMRGPNPDTTLMIWGGNRVPVTPGNQCFHPPDAGPQVTPPPHPPPARPTGNRRSARPLKLKARACGTAAQRPPRFHGDPSLLHSTMKL